MAASDWKGASAVLRRHVNLASSPVAVALLEESKTLLEHPQLRILHKTAPCHMAAYARYYREEGVVGASSEGVKCIWGATCLGLMKAPERLEEGLVMKQFTSDIVSGKELQEAVGALGEGGRRYAASVMAPLDLTPIDPDVIILYVTPAQALRLIIAYTFEKGETPYSKITGQSSLCSAIAHAVQEKAMVIDIPCMGDRTYGLVQEQEMIVAFPAGRTTQICTGLRQTESFAAHPFKPFLHWPVILPPDMEPRGPELE